MLHLKFMGGNRVLLSVVVPCYNEGSVITESCCKLDKMLSEDESINGRYEIILIVEKSKDDTLEKAQMLQASLASIVVLENDKTYGKGYSVKRGILSSQGEYILAIDADLPIDLSRYLPIMFMLIENSNTAAVYASAIWEKLNFKKRNLFRTILTFGLMILRRWVLNQEVSDSQFGCKLYKASHVERFVKRMEIHNYLYDICLTDMILDSGYDIQECVVKVDCFNEKSSIKISSVYSCSKTFLQYSIWGRKEYLRKEVKPECLTET